MNKLLFTIALCAWILNVHAQNGDDVSTSQTISSLLETQPEKKVKDIDESFAVSIGLSSIQSNIYTPGDAYSDCGGLDAMAEYDYVYPSGFGFGVTIALNHTSLPDHTKIKQLFFGPSLVYAGYLGEKWWAKVDFGLGYGNCIQDHAISTGLGAKSSISFDYMVTPTIGIGAQLSTFKTFFGKSKDYGRDEVNGIARLGLSINLRKHL